MNNEKYTFRTATEALPFIASRILDIGDEVGSRNGRTKELLNTQIVITDPQRREIVTLNRKANVFAQIAETMWVLSGRNDVEWLSAYLPRAKDYSDDGKTWRGGYGPRIRHWHAGDDVHGERYVDQVAHVVDLLRADPLSRRAVIAIYDPVIDAGDGKDIPCNDFLQFQSRLGALHMTVTVRSNDLMWGWSGINAFEWSTLQEIIAHVLGIAVGTLTFNIGSLHLYERHWDKAARLEHEDLDAAITPFTLPEDQRTLDGVDHWIDEWFRWEAACRTGDVTVGEVLNTEEPLFREWAIAIAYYWTRDEQWLKMLHGTALAVAVARTPASVLSEAPQTSRSTAPVPGHPAHLHERTGAFYEFVKNLHAEKHQSYGDSWKKRGEKMSILANIARKVDRIGVGDSFDSSADTLIDLLVYLAKYHCWIQNHDDGPTGVNLRIAEVLSQTEEYDTEGQALDITYTDIQSEFDSYCDHVDDYADTPKLQFITDLMLAVAPVARDVWWREQPGRDTITLVGEQGPELILPNAGDDYRGADHD